MLIEATITRTASIATAGITVARFVTGRYRFKGDGTFQLWNADQGLWFSLGVEGVSGQEVLTLDSVGEPNTGNSALPVLRSVAGKYRFNSDNALQLWNAQQSLWFSLGVQGTLGREVLTLTVPGES